MNYEQGGLESGPVLVCVPGLLGGKEDFHKIFTELAKYFTVITIDPNEKVRVEVGLNIDIKIMNEISYDHVTKDIEQTLLSKFPNRKYFFLGVSIGGKIVFDFACKFPHLYHGGVIIDVGAGSLNDSELFKFVKQTVDNVNLDLPWPELKKSLQDVIQDKNLRILIQSQIYYPNKTPPATWKVGISHFSNLLSRQKIQNQEEKFSKLDPDLAKANSITHILHAEFLSGICPESFKKLQKLKSVKIYEVANATHFLHITHFDLIKDLTIKMLNQSAQ